MLTDIFAYRYADVPMWDQFGEAERRLLVQGFRVVSDQLFPYWGADGNEVDGAKEVWRRLHDQLSMELGLEELSRRFIPSGNPAGGWTQLAWVHICKAFVLAPFDPNVSADQFVKERLSLVELAFREREAQVAKANRELEGNLAVIAAFERVAPSPMGRLPGGSQSEMKRAANDAMNRAFREQVDELNERFRRAGAPLHYHNGFIQVSEDSLVEAQVEAPFWELVKDAKWENVDTDLKEAIDRRDGGGRDPALYAAKALESAIKIISGEKGWTRGNERGAHGFIDNLGARSNGYFIQAWEKDELKHFFTHVRNPLGHGPGGEPMPELSPQQTSWAIEYCMSWIKSLILRA